MFENDDGGVQIDHFFMCFFGSSWFWSLMDEMYVWKPPWLKWKFDGEIREGFVWKPPWFKQWVNASSGREHRQILE
jgi:hypothetical protein